MNGSPRAFRATVLEFERRALLARLLPAPPPSLPPSTDTVSFGGPGGSGVFIQEVSQQSGVATVELSRYNSSTIINHPLQVQVTTDASSPYVGVNVAAVNQTVTFPAGHLFAELTVPIIAGAANPGEVDVNLTMTTVNPSPSLAVSLQVPVEELKILASDAAIPPAIVATNGTPYGIQLIFSKPMDPVQASNVKNYAVYATTVHGNSPGFFSFYISFTTVRTPVPLKAAVYDAATNTVTLIPRRPFFSYGMGLTVTQGAPSRTAGRANAGAAAMHGLVDLEEHLIEQAARPPGKFTVTVAKGFNLTTS